MRKTKRSKISALLLSMLMVFAITPLSVFADGEDVSMVKAIADSGDITVNKGNVSPGGAPWNSSSANYGVYAYAENEHTATVNVKDVTSTASNSFVYGVGAFNADDSKGNVYVTTGNITSIGYGINAGAYKGGNTSVTVSGNVVAGYNETYGPGVFAEARENGTTSVVIKGDVSAKSDGLKVASIVQNDSATVSIKVYGDVTTTGDAGVVFCGRTSAQDILVSKKILGNKYGVVTDTLYYSDMGTENNLTVWKVENSSGNANELFVERVGFSEYETDNVSALSAKYIIKYAENIKPLKENGSALDKSHDLAVAKEGDKVLITAANGNTITKAYNNGVEVTTKDDNGNYYIIVPRGGGIDLTADVSTTQAQTNNTTTDANTDPNPGTNITPTPGRQASDKVDQPSSVSTKEQATQQSSGSNTDVVSKTTPETTTHLHSLSEVAKVEPTCEDAGTEKYWKCSECGKMFSDAEGTNEISAPIEIPAQGHTMKTVKKAAGLLKNGSTYKKCTKCGLQSDAKVLLGWSKSYVKSLKVTKDKKTFTVKWKKQSKKKQKEFSGYQIRYSTKKNFKNAKTVNVKKSASKKKIKAKANNTYYVQVRTYKTVKGVKYYSSWSKTKTVKN